MRSTYTCTIGFILSSIVIIIDISMCTCLRRRLHSVYALSLYLGVCERICNFSDAVRPTKTVTPNQSVQEQY